MSEDNTSKIKQLARQIKGDPNDSFSKFALALEFRKQGKVKKARILFENILQSDPDYAGVYYHLGKLYEQSGRLTDAQEIYKRGVAVAREQNKKRTVSELEEAILQVEIEISEGEHQ